MGVFGMFPHLGLQEMEKKGRDNPLLFAMFDALSLCLAVFGPACGVRMSGNAVPNVCQNFQTALCRPL